MTSKAFACLLGLALTASPAWSQSADRRIDLPGGLNRPALELAQSALTTFDLDDADLVLLKRQEHAAGVTHRFVMTRAGLPSDEQLLVIQTRAGESWAVTDAVKAGFVDTFESRTTFASLASALSSLGLDGRDDGVEASVDRRISRRVGGQYRLFHVVTVRATTLALDATLELTVSPRNGEVVFQRSLRFDANGTGDVFDPNPVQTSGTVFTDQNDSNNAIPSSEYFTRTLQGLDGSGFLTGPYASTSITSGRTNQPSLVYQFLRGQNAFEEVVAYYHVDEFQRWLQSLGFNNANNRQQRMDVHAGSFDNSYYDGSNGNLYFGDGGVDDAEDAEIVLHEYGHSVHDDISGIGGGQNGAMSEGFGDYLAASRFANARVGEWDAVSYDSHNPPYLRRVDGNKHYPEDLVSQVHADGEIWSAALWDLMQDLGAATADSLVIQGMFSQTSSSNMTAAANTIVQADQSLYGGSHIPVVEGAFVSRGILNVTANYSNTTVELSSRETKPQPGNNYTLDLAAGGANGNAQFIIVPAPTTGNTPLPGTSKHLDVGVQWIGFLGLFPALTGTLNGSGNRSVTLNLPSQTPVGLRFYLQYVTIVNNQFNSVSNVVPLRAQGY